MKHLTEEILISNFWGTWQLVSCKLFTADNVERPDPFHDASGMLTYILKKVS